ncbi:hypothetical protein [Actinoplanes sp. NPDC051411]|uniref:hypothetical protein n=1 Tax=Actinoplanes sp. NPDC051411 TaxID=3155522 RepID=UPI0034278549
MADDAELFEGLDQIRWAEMTDAYGTAEEVPGVLRDLVDADPFTRATARHRFEGEVHHQLDVYESTVAAVPFLLRMAQRPDVPGRAAVVQLLASVAGADEPGLLPGRSGFPAAATGLVAGAYALWVRLLEDPDPSIREATCPALLVCVDRSAEVAEALLDRLAREPDPRVLTAIVRTATAMTAAGRLSGLEDRLRLLAGRTADPVRRLTLLTALIELSPPGAPEPAWPAAELMPVVSAAYRSAPVEAKRPPLVDRLSEAYGDRVPERVTLLTTLLRAPDQVQRADALYPARRLIWNWRGSYAELIAQVGEQLRDEPAELWEPALLVLQNLRRLGAPAADGLVARLTASPVRPSGSSTPITWLTGTGGGSFRVGDALKVLCASGDPRAVPMVATILRDGPLPEDADTLVWGLVDQVTPLVPLVVRAFRERSPGDRQRAGLLRALRLIGPPAAAVLPDLLTVPVSRDMLHAIDAIDAGHPATRRTLREAATSPDRDIAAAAAAARWHGAADPGPAGAVIDHYLDRDDHWDKRTALDLIAEIGPAGHRYAAPLRGLLTDGNARLRISAARALWQVTGDAEPVLPVYAALWRSAPDLRGVVAAGYAEMGSAAATARPLILEEIDRPRRHNVHEHTNSSHQVIEDEQLLADCRAVLDTITP